MLYVFSFSGWEKLEGFFLKHSDYGLKMRLKALMKQAKRSPKTL